MVTQVVRDTLSLAGISCLSLGMLGASAGIWRSLDARSFTGTTLDARSLEQLTGLVLGLLGALVLAWLLVCLGLAIVARLACACGHQRQAAILAGVVPAFVARLALAGLGGSLVLATCSLAAGPAGAATAIAVAAPALPQMQLETSPGTLPVHEAVKLPSEAVVPPGETELLSPGWIPHRVPLQMQRLVGGGNTRPVAEVVVGPGDSLWSIAARNLPEGASAEDISASWPRWYKANRQLIGPDPNRLYIGMVLQAPQTESLRS